VYGSTAHGFTTIAAPDQLDHKSRLGLEKRSGFTIPAAYERDGGEPPVKHSCFAVGDALVVGRAVYLGVDMTGRKGNYVCHNLMFSRDEVERNVTDPVALIRACEAAGAFLDQAPAEGIGTLPLITVPVPTDASDPAPIADDALARAAIAFALDRTPQTEPILALGRDADVLAFLEGVFGALPSSMRWNLAFDTYIEGSDWREMGVVGIPNETDWSSRKPPHSFEVDSVHQTFTQSGPPSANDLADILARSRTSEGTEHEFMLSVIDLIEQARWEEVPEVWAGVSRGNAELLFRQYHPRIVERIAAAKDLRLAQTVLDLLVARDLDALARVPGLVEDLAALPGSELLIMPWFWAQPSDDRRAQIVVASPAALNSTFNKITSGDEGWRNVVVALLGQMRRPHTAELEFRILSPVIRWQNDIKSAATRESIIQIVSSLPPCDAELRCERLYARSCVGDLEATKQLLPTVAQYSPTVFLGDHPEAPRLTLSRLAHEGEDAQKSVVALGSMTQGTPEIACRMVGDAVAAILADPNIKEGHRKHFAKQTMSALGGFGQASWPRGPYAACERYLGPSVGDRLKSMWGRGKDR
jgi:hypothetical protein